MRIYFGENILNTQKWHHLIPYEAMLDVSVIPGVNLLKLVQVQFTSVAIVFRLKKKKLQL